MCCGTCRRAGRADLGVAPSSSGLSSLTYEPYYGLKEKPFSLSADPRFLFRSPEHAPAFEELLNGIRRREGLITLTGEIGTGKTTLIRSVLQHLDRRTFSAFVPDPFVSREDLLKMLLVDFGVVSIADLKRGSLNGASRPDLSYPLYEFLDSLVPLQAFAVLIIDEAQNLPLPLLEEIRILSDLEGREKLLQVVLVGQPELRAHLKLPEMRQVDQRVSVRCELTPLGARWRRRLHRIIVCASPSEGHARVEFSEQAIDAVYEGSGGTPRLINLICDRALHRGYGARVGRIEPDFVWDAIGDLGLEIARRRTGRLRASRTGASAEPPKRRSADRCADAAAMPRSQRRLLFAPVQREAPVRVAGPRPRTAHRLRAGAQARFVAAIERWHRARMDAGRGGCTASPLVAMGGMFAYVRVQAAERVPDAADSRRRRRTSLRHCPRPCVRQQRFAIQVASFETMPRAERLVAAAHEHRLSTLAPSNWIRARARPHRGGTGRRLSNG